MSLAASASPRRASLDSDVILISTSPPPASVAARLHRQHHQLALPLPSITTSPAALRPPVRSSSPRHHAHVSSAPPNSTAPPPSNLANPLLSPSSPPPPQPHRFPRRSFLPAADGPSLPVFLPEFPYHPSARPPRFRSATASPPPPSPPDDDDEMFQDDSFQDDSYRDPHATTTTTTSASTTQTSDCTGRRSAPDVPDSPSQQLHTGPSAHTTQNTDFSLPDTQFVQDLLDDDGQGNTETASTSFSENAMPPTQLRRADSGLLPPPSLKRRRSPPQTEPPLRRARQERPVKPLDSDDDVFGDSLKASTLPEDENLTTIDLTEATEVPPELLRPLVDNRVKIAAFQCAICMDNVTGLTVTHCGHLFCAECLHHSLDLESTKGKCPMCRSKIDMKMRHEYGSKTRGYWPLELKLMTTTRKGKRKADDISK